MLGLIAKDVRFTLRWTLIGIVSICVVGTVFVWKVDSGVMMVMLLTPPLLFGQLVGRGCYMDDKDGGFAFLRALPLCASDIVRSRFLEALGVLVVGMALSWVVIVVGSGLGGVPVVWPWEMVVYLAAMMVVFFAVYLGAFFVFDYAVAQQTNLFVVVMLAALTQVQRLLALLPSELAASLQGMPLAIVSLCAALGILCASAALSVRSLESKG